MNHFLRFSTLFSASIFMVLVAHATDITLNLGDKITLNAGDSTTVTCASASGTGGVRSFTICDCTNNGFFQGQAIGIDDLVDQCAILNAVPRNCAASAAPVTCDCTGSFGVFIGQASGYRNLVGQCAKMNGAPRNCHP